MSDLIDRQAAIDAIDHICPVDTEYDCTLLDRVDVRYVLSDLPSAQPEIIRCKDCKHHGTNGCRLNCAVFCCTMPDDGFCSFGKRREDG